MDRAILSQKLRAHTMTLSEPEIITLKELHWIFNSSRTKKVSASGVVSYVWDNELAENLYLHLKKRLWKYFEADFEEILREFGAGE